MAPPRGRKVSGRGRAPGVLSRFPLPGPRWAWVGLLVLAFFLGVPLAHAFLGELAAVGLLVFLGGFVAGRLSVRL